jgi:16S rRNA (guanine527-N7)-methyltransferase
MQRVDNPHNDQDPQSAAKLISGAGELGWDLGPHQAEMLLAYVSLLNSWNAVHNLSALRRPKDSVSKNVLDSLAIVRPLVNFTGRSGAIRILDAGTGAGLPAVILAIMRPDWVVLAVDAVAKKIAFVRQAAGQLGLTNLHPKHSRLERLTCEPVDVVTARALGSLAELVSSTRHLLKAEGVWVAMKGKRPDDEISALPKDVRVFHVEQLRIPVVQGERCLAWIRRVGGGPNE